MGMNCKEGSLLRRVLRVGSLWSGSGVAGGRTVQIVVKATIPVYGRILVVRRADSPSSFGVRNAMK